MKVLKTAEIHVMSPPLLAQSRTVKIYVSVLVCCIVTYDIVVDSWLVEERR